MVEQQQRCLCQAQLRPMPAASRSATDASRNAPAEATPVRFATRATDLRRKSPTPTTLPRLSWAPPMPRSPSDLLVSNALRHPS
ncbi:hypothetical protein Fmac_004632 [Flemingia macrophylla]|uniref:Uncharacterized protein n=1 Tax=Flemingia macrophylla TaxID=520843 RepID=A0ABD1N5G5_9FABA